MVRSSPSTATVFIFSGHSFFSAFLIIIIMQWNMHVIHNRTVCCAIFFSFFPLLLFLHSHQRRRLFHRTSHTMHNVFGYCRSFSSVLGFLLLLCYVFGLSFWRLHFADHHELSNQKKRTFRLEWSAKVHLLPRPESNFGERNFGAVFLEGNSCDVEKISCNSNWIARKVSFSFIYIRHPTHNNVVQFAW